VAWCALVATACSTDDGGNTEGRSGTDAPASTTAVPPSGAPSSETPTSESQEPVAAEAPASSTTPDEPRWVSGDDEVLYDQERLHTFELDLPEESLARIDADPAAEEYVEASLTFDGETVEPVGLRYKGSVGAFVGCTSGASPLAAEGPKTCTKLSMQVKINWDDPERKFYGVRRLQFHAQNLDSTLMHERLGYWLFREMGVPAPRSTHARVVINGEYVGLFALTEELDGRFTRANFDDGTGNLYKEVWPFDAEGAPRPSSDFIDGLATNEDENPSADLIVTFAEDFAAATPDERLDVLDRWFDIETLVATMVVDRAIRHDDGPLHWYCFSECEPHNFYFYEDPTREVLTLVPWDLDNAFDALTPGSAVGNFVAIADPFGEITNDCEPFPFGAFNLPQRSAACDPLVATIASLTDEYDRQRARLLAGPFAEERVEEQLATWTRQIEPAVAEAAELHDDAPSVDSWKRALEQFRVALQASRDGSGR
jgi:hypothetical protein